MFLGRFFILFGDRTGLFDRIGGGVGGWIGGGGGIGSGIVAVGVVF